MLRRARESQVVNIYGGVGGHGGGGGKQGGGGGAGEGPTVTTNIEAVTVHLTQNHRSVESHGSQVVSRDSSGAARNPRRGMGSHETSFDLSGSPEENPSEGRTSFFRHPMLAVRKATRFLIFPRARNTVSTNRGIPPSERHPVDNPVVRANPAVRDIATPPSHNHRSDSASEDSLPSFGRPHPAPEPSRSFHAPTFITTETLNNHHAEAGINILHRAVALEALYDSADSFPQPRCHPETRTAMLDILYKWAVQPDSARPIHWLYGPAGAGKSAIMQTLCQKLQTAGRIGGAFFFKRDHTTRGNARVLFSTLAYQLALNNHTLKSAISRSVERDPSAVGRSMGVQLHQLIIEPCRSLTNCPPLILLIDGLDECQDEDAQQSILHLIKSTVVVLRQPEAHIREIFKDASFDGILDYMNVRQSFEDIRTYFIDEFARICREHRTMVDVPTPWPSPEILDYLVEKSSGYFIYASTVIKFIDDKYSHPKERLAVVQYLAPSTSETPFAALDQLYIQILSQVPTRFRSKLRDVLQCTIVSDMKLYRVQLEWFLGLEPGGVELILRGLHSVLKVTPYAMFRIGSGISVHHASFLDFLQDQQRSTSFYIDSENRKNVALAVLKEFSDDNHWLDTPDHPLAW
ncbi:putative nwd2 protein [Mycena venus]|uniref:Putative nwd2 protein n=1 Tax=Mycena venus TaxID=2733690 RepID=A0A8H7CAT5_9AGAR|nr:putative nwd2 protein [Mycena venus]